MTSRSAKEKSDYSRYMDQQVASLWEKRDEGFLRGTRDKKLYWASVTSPDHCKAVVLVNGRVESSFKYQELIFNFFELGYDVFTFDHRGQGLSDRLTADSQIGHVEEFEDYVDDMELLLNSFNLIKYQERYILSHSMGGAIATRYLQTKSSHSFNGMALSAPMYGINLSPLERLVAPYLTEVISKIWPTPFYLTKNKAYYRKPFEGNLLTSSYERYQWFRDLYEKMPEIKLGGPSARWVWQSLRSCSDCIKDTERLRCPVLLLQGGDDKIISNEAQLKFFNKLQLTNPDTRLKVLDGCRHEVLFETDTHRDAAISEIVNFFEEYGSR